MPQDTLKKLRADMEARLAELRDELHDTRGEVAMLVLTSNEQVLGIKTLPDGTKQFPNAPTGPVVNTVPNTTPAVPKEYGVGAVVKFQGADYMVERVGDGVLMINRLNDSPLWLYPRDVVLVTPAP